MSEKIFTPYRRKHETELRPYEPGEDMSGISIAPGDRYNGSPRAGDMIARNPLNHAEKWLVAERYFRDNYDAIG